jgi:small neutral amino acid transporter SnatA (MarC family)
VRAVYLVAIVFGVLLLGGGVLYFAVSMSEGSDIGGGRAMVVCAVGLVLIVGGCSNVPKSHDSCNGATECGTP